MEYRKILTPDGFDDCLELQFSCKNNVLLRLHHIFNSYGYSRISPPTLEYIDVFTNKGSLDTKNIFKFIDKDGEILALRPDITPSIARIVSNNFDTKSIPYRFCYIENTFAQNRTYQGKSKELTQAGVELIGFDSVKSDCEILLLAINSLLETGLKDFKLEIGNIKFLQGYLLDLNISNEEKHTLEKLIIKGNFAQVNNFVANLKITDEQKDFFCNLFTFSGDVNILHTVKKYIRNEISTSALERLIEINKFLEDAGVSDYINFDLSLIGHFDYYTGLLFHGYTKAVGYSILDGGRYDKLIENGGDYVPSIGFAIKVNELVDGLFKQNQFEINRNNDTLISYTEETRKLALQATEILRADNGVYEYSLFNEIEQTIEYAKKNGFGGILHFKNSDIVDIIDLTTNETNEISIGQLIGGNDDER